MSLRVRAPGPPRCWDNLGRAPPCRPDRLTSPQGYTENLAYKDFAPYSYLDGFYDDPSTRGTTNKRATLVAETGDNKALQVLLPQGCVTSECAMQAKHVFIQPSESVTLKFRCARCRKAHDRRSSVVTADRASSRPALEPSRCQAPVQCSRAVAANAQGRLCGRNLAARPARAMQSAARRMKFGPNFDWVRGGKLPGLCGAECQTGCKEVTGLDGFSSRQMWRPCIWPPESPLNEINCEGGKMVAYVYHMDKVHWCGDDFEFGNEVWAREYFTPKDPVVPKDFFQPNPDEWYTIWSHVAMNTAGAPWAATLCLRRCHAA